MHRIIHLLLFTTLLCSCHEDSGKSKYDPERGVTGLPKDDTGFLRLMDTAQKRLPEFIRMLETNGSNADYYFLLKSAYHEGDQTEHMWSYPIPLNQDTLTCVLIDSAYQLTNFKKGDTTMILQKTIEDWAIYNSKMELIKGSFSEKYLKGKE